MRGIPVFNYLIIFSLNLYFLGSMKRAILEVIASSVANTPGEVEKYANCTLLSVSMQDSDSTSSSQVTDNTIQSCVKFLEENEFIR